MEVLYLIAKKANYKKYWDLQENILEYNLEIKKQNRLKSEEKPTLNVFIICEHHPVYTLGKSGKEENLLLTPEELKEKGIDYWRINRGGDITYHGPGQITGYPVLDLECFNPSAAWFIENMENFIMDTLSDYAIKSDRIDELTGIWIKGHTQSEDRKICAIGVKMSRYVSIHGFALNVNTDLTYFNNIIPCGIDDKEVTSIEREVGTEIPFDEVISKVLSHFSQRFNVSLRESSEDEIHKILAK